MLYVLNNILSWFVVSKSVKMNIHKKSIFKASEYCLMLKLQKS